MALIIDNFEDNDLNEYTTIQSGNTITVQSSTTYNGSYALQMTTASGGSWEEIHSTSGLSNYPSPGDTFRVWVNRSSQDNRGRTEIQFGGSDSGNCYVVRTHWGRPETMILKRSGGGDNKLTSTGQRSSFDQWVYYDITWGTGGSINVSVNGEFSISTTDSTYGSGGFGFASQCAGQTSTWYDYAYIEESVSPPDAPSNVSSTVDSNEQITTSWDPPSNWNGDQGNYRVQFSRDGTNYQNPSGGPTTPGSGTTSASYGPNSDNSYQSQVGIDSSFKFRVRAENSAGSSSWSYSGTVYTESIPPSDLSVNRTGSNTFEFSITQNSNIASGTVIEARKDTGSCYGSWGWLDTEGANSGTVTRTLTTGDGENVTLQEDARYQFRAYTYVSSNRSRDSKRSYFDYGNNGNVWLDENCDSTSWDYSAGSPEVRTGSLGDAGISGSNYGSGHILCRGGDDVEWDVDAATDDVSNVLVQATMAVGSMDYSGEDALLQWYDGSSWQNLSDRYGPEYNKQGWVEVNCIVPSSWIASNNNIRFRNPHGGGGDYALIDRLIVSDVLHEYTMPTAPTNLASESVDDGELALTWTDNATFEDRYEIFYRQSGNSSWTKDHNESTDATSATITGLNTATTYDLKTREVVEQPRNGSINSWWYHDNVHPSITTPYGVFELSTASGDISVPVFDPSEVSDNPLRVQTANGEAAFNLIDPSNSDSTALRIYSGGIVKAIRFNNVL